ncbi:uncharacterized protein [Montipora foliosa]|uniref:uncharacterized protein n=1 Tax=Montipora foliosa TaxID=591990 RepID=UPI0035F11CF5
MSRDLSFPSTSSSASRGAHESMSGQAASRKLKVTLLSSEWQSTKGSLSTINRELAIQLAKHQNLEVSVYLPECSEEDARIAGENYVKLIKARKLIGYEPIEWLSYAPQNHEIDYVIGHGLTLGKQVQLIQRYINCKWIQVVHTAPEDLGMFEGYANAISRSEERHKAEIELCELADEVVAVGPKLANAYSHYLRHCQRDQSVIVLTPSIFSEFSPVQQSTEERRTFCVLVFGRGDTEDFKLKGYDIAAKAISELNEESYQLIFVGAPVEKKEEVAEKLCQYGIARRQLTVRSVIESREDIVRLFCEVDLCIMPSRTEGFGLAALEALSAGLPILVSGNSGLGDALQNVPHGSSCVVDSEDPADWANAIKRVRRKRRNVRLKEMKDLCIQYAEEYSWEKQCGELVGRMVGTCRLPIQIDVETVTEGSTQRGTGMEVHPREPQEVVREVRVPNTGLTTENIGNICSQSTQALLNRIAELYLQHVSPSNPEQFNGFIVYLKEVRKVLVLDVTLGSLIVTVEVGSEEILEELWKDYRAGLLYEVAQTFLVTEELLEECGLTELKLTLHIAEEEYNACKRYFWGTRQASESEQDSPLPTPMAAEAFVEPTGKRPSHPSDTPPSKKRRHDTDICRGTHHASLEEEASSITTTHLATAVDTQARNLYGAAIADPVVVKLLRHVYKRRAEFSPLLWSQAMKLHLGEVYTRLKIVSRPKKSVHSEGSEIDLGNIFGCKGEDSMVIAEGSPGIGKTTVCLKLAYDWANESMPPTFPVFELLLLLKCRDLDGEIMEAIFEQLLPEDMEEKAKKRLRNFITDIHSQERILIILDGLDELPERSKHHVDKLLDRKILPFCYVLATARQEKGIEARKQFAFDICLQIEGFTEEDSFKYIRKHFQNIDPSKGERLIKETKENTFLHPLRNNPLNLLLLCVVYEDHKGELPSSRTNLYQIIVRCLLRRYCEKNGVKACEEDSDLEKQFEADILVLGELAWKCLLSDRHSFREDELKDFERSDGKLVVRYLGLVYKEESLKRLKPQHEYFFLHKSFQEYLAASYIAHKLRSNQFDVFKHVDFDYVVKKCPQVFLFVCGILRGEAIILFTQIGETLKSNWDWLRCGFEESHFFVQSFWESGNPERMADTLFSFLSFPRVLHLSLLDDEGLDLPGAWNVVTVLKACSGFSKVQTPEVHIKIPLDVYFNKSDELESVPKIKSLNITECSFDVRYLVNPILGISDFTSLSELTLPSLCCAELLTTRSKTLQKVTVTLSNELSDGWARTLEAGLCAVTPLSSVGLRIRGSLSQTAIKAFENLLCNRYLTSLSLFLCGDMQDSLAVALATGLAGQIAVKVLDLCVDGKLSLHGANLIERGIVENNSLTKLIVSLRGEVPDNWQTVVRNIHSRLGRETSASFALYPDTFGKVTATQVTQCLIPFEIRDGLLAQQNVTLNVWGELGGDGAEALFEGLSRKQVSHLTLDIHGKLTDDILNSTARWVEERNTQSSITINTWEQLTKEEKNLFEELKLDKNPAVTLNVRDVHAPPEESRDDEFVSIHDLESLIALFKEAKNTGKQNLSARISTKRDDDEDKDDDDDEDDDDDSEDDDGEDDDGEDDDGEDDDDDGNGVDAGAASNTSFNFSREPEDGLDHVLASNTTLNALSLTLDDDDDIRYPWAILLGSGLARNTSLKNLTLTINVHKEKSDRWVDYLGLMSNTWSNILGNGLEHNTSLKNLTLIIENHSSILEHKPCIDWARKTSVKNLTLTINNFGELNLDWEDNGLENKSLNDFSLTINNYGNISGVSGIPGSLCQLKSLSTLNLTLNLCGKGGKEILPCLLEKAMEIESLKTLRLKVNDRQSANGSCGYDFSNFVVMSPSLSLIEVTVSFYGVEESSRE